MDWKYEHFSHEAIYKAFPASVLEAARAVMSEAFGATEETRDIPIQELSRGPNFSIDPRIFISVRLGRI